MVQQANGVFGGDLLNTGQRYVFGLRQDRVHTAGAAALMRLPKGGFTNLLVCVVGKRVKAGGFGRVLVNHLFRHTTIKAFLRFAGRAGRPALTSYVHGSCWRAVMAWFSAIFLP